MARLNGSSPVDCRAQVGLEFIAFRLEGREGGDITADSDLRDGLRRFRGWRRKGIGSRSLARSREKRGVSVGASTSKRGGT